MKPVNAILKLINPTYKKVCKLEENQITKENLSNILSCLFDIHSLRKATGAVRKIQNVNNYLLTELKNICDELKIKFWLRGGTLLGAVRHKGYIPWDDDIDTGMIREDFGILTEFLKTNQKYEIKEHYNSCTRCKVYRFCFRNTCSSAWVDIFPFDWCDISKKDEVWENWLKCRRKIDKFYKKLRMERYSDICYEDRTNHKIAKLNKVLDEYVKKYSDNEQKTGIILGIEQLTPQSFHEPICYNQNSMFPLIKMEFENVEHYIPNDYDRILTEYYGNYMMFPQEMILRHNKQINLSEVLALHDRLHTGEGR